MSHASLERRRVLVVEDEYFIALDLEQTLQDAGASVAGPVSTVIDALALIEAGPGLDAAVLDVNLSGETVLPVADRLLTQGVPIVLVTGYGHADLPARLRHVPRLEKPVNAGQLARAISQAVLRGCEGQKGI